MDRKKFIKEIYAKYWLSARHNDYGFLEYDRNLCNFILANCNKDKILEVAIGTGFPFADYFQKQGYEVYGIDIAPILIEKCKKFNNKIICKIGDAEDIEYPTNFFLCTYCFHSTFYFSNLKQSIKEMIRVTKPGGLVIFDIQNADNYMTILNNNKLILNKSNYFRRFVRYVKNIIKFFLKKGLIDWTQTIPETPSYPSDILSYLREEGIRDYDIFARLSNEKLKKIDNVYDLKNYSRLVFSISKN